LLSLVTYLSAAPATQEGLDLERLALLKSVLQKLSVRANANAAQPALTAQKALKSAVSTDKLSKDGSRSVSAADIAEFAASANDVIQAVLLSLPGAAARIATAATGTDAEFAAALNEVEDAMEKVDRTKIPKFYIKFSDLAVKELIYGLLDKPACESEEDCVQQAEDDEELFSGKIAEISKQLTDQREQCLANEGFPVSIEMKKLVVSGMSKTAGGKSKRRATIFRAKGKGNNENSKSKSKSKSGKGKSSSGGPGNQADNAAFAKDIAQFIVGALTSADLTKDNADLAGPISAHLKCATEQFESVQKWIADTFLNGIDESDADKARSDLAQLLGYVYVLHEDVSYGIFYLQLVSLVKGTKVVTLDELMNFYEKFRQGFSTISEEFEAATEALANYAGDDMATVSDFFDGINIMAFELWRIRNAADRTLRNAILMGFEWAETCADKDYDSPEFNICITEALEIALDKGEDFEKKLRKIIKETFGEKKCRNIRDQLAALQENLEGDAGIHNNDIDIEPDWDRAADNFTGLGDDLRCLAERAGLLESIDYEREDQTQVLLELLIVLDHLGDVANQVSEDSISLLQAINWRNHLSSMFDAKKRSMAASMTSVKNTITQSLAKLDNMRHQASNSRSLLGIKLGNQKQNASSQADPNDGGNQSSQSSAATDKINQLAKMLQEVLQNN